MNDDDLNAHFLWLHDFDSAGDWALTQGYRHDKHTDTWYDDEGKPVDIHERLTKMIMDDTHRYLDSLY